MTDVRLSRGGSFQRYMEQLPAAFAVTRGPEYKIVYANAAFGELAVGPEKPRLGMILADALDGCDAKPLNELLDRVRQTGVVARDVFIQRNEESTPALYGTVWPLFSEGEADSLLIELRVATIAERTHALGQLAAERTLLRVVSERMLLSALREQDSAAEAEASRQRAAFLDAEGRRLTESLDEGATLDAMRRMSLPLGAWCVVDIIDVDRTISRLAIVHPDAGKQHLIRELESRWSPEPDDMFGVPAMLRRAAVKLAVQGPDEPLLGRSRDPETTRILRALGVGPILTVPLVIQERLAGAVTFVAGDGRSFTPHDVELAKNLAARSAMALERARAYGEAVALRIEAERANEAKTAFLGAMSHEFRTPLNAIAGYLELLEMGLHGPVTKQQHTDIARIRASQLHLTSLVEDLLNLTKLTSGKLAFDLTGVIVRDALVAAVALVDPLISGKGLSFAGITCDSAIVARADLEKLNQILVNLLSNAIKFTASGGQIGVECESKDQNVLIHVWDTGVGIPSNMLESIFDPFVQVKSGLAGKDVGVGLGLSISRGLSRAMQGDLSVQSTLGEGTRFTLQLPRTRP